jgi:enamine deaminase RidA (YjgF/YER057c/UK114 family)
VRLALDAVGMTYDHVVKLQVFVTDIADLPRLREIRDAYVNTKNPPASTVVQIAALFRPDVLLEMDAVAVG